MSQQALASYYEAEVRCYHCGHTSGVVRRDRSGPGAVMMYQAGSVGEPVPVRGLTDLRCARCHGSVYTDEFEVRYVYPKVDFFEDRPRRGRPPKRLVEMRRAEQEALKSA